MKKLITLSLLALSTWMVSCTKEDEESLPGPSIAQSDVKFSVKQQAGHDNIIMLEGLTQNVYLHYWDFTGGYSKKQKDTINLPFAGTYTIHYSVYTHGGVLGDSTNITVSQNDPDYFSSPMWNLLANAQTGKTWVWATDVPGGAVYGNGPGTATKPEWWVNGLAYLTSQGVQDDEMKFDLDGAKNFTFTHNGVSTAARFDLDTLNKTLKITGSDISLGKKITYSIVTLNENELTLVEQGDGWRNLWLFKRKGYSY
ncbi:MAG TPA: hypothetical protein VJ720_10700 [Chitinophaga sp.]|nr:hypothetical protein [Chitinophaga sp.]